MPSFDLLFGGHWFTITPDEYVVPVFADESYCSICLVADSGDWILGSAFLRGYYNIHDHTNSRMGFVPFPGSPKAKPVASTCTITCTDTNNGASD